MRCGGSRRLLLKRYGGWKQCPLADTWSDEEEGGDTGDALL